MSLAPGRPAAPAAATVGSLFCGAGGLDWGFHGDGFRIIRAFDTMRGARLTYERNFRVPVDSTDVATLDDYALSGCDVLLAGPPCQGFSSIGRRDPDDPRNQLIIRTARLIAAAKPKAFVVENVRGLRWNSSGKFVTRMLAIFAKAKLNAQVIEVDCSRLGVAQHRRRVLVVGGRGAIGRAVIAKSTKALGESAPPVTAGEVLLSRDGLAATPNHVVNRPMPAWYREVIQAIGPGQKLCDTRLGPASIHSWDVPQVYGHVSAGEREALLALARLRRRIEGRRYIHFGDGRPATLRQLARALGLPVSDVASLMRRLAEKGFIRMPRRGYVDLARKFNGRFKRLPADKPAPAVLEEFSSPRNILHPTLPRALTVRECARLQTFPDSFEFIGSRTEQYQLVANAFPPVISARIARAIEEALTGCRVGQGES